MAFHFPHYLARSDAIQAGRWPIAPTAEMTPIAYQNSLKLVSVRGGGAVSKGIRLHTVDDSDTLSPYDPARSLLSTDLGYATTPDMDIALKHLCVH